VKDDHFQLIGKIFRFAKWPDLIACRAESNGSGMNRTSSGAFLIKSVSISLKDVLGPKEDLCDGPTMHYCACEQS
jgi:hypothetical protein